MATKTSKRTTTAPKTTSRAKTGTTAAKTTSAKTGAAKTGAAKTTAPESAPKAATTPTATAAPAKAKVTAPAPASVPAAPVADADKPKVVTDTPVVAGPTLRKKEFIDRVVTRSGLKKKDAKPAVEAALAELGEAIARGEELNLPPFGKLKVNREKDLANAQVLICKLRRPKGMDVPPGGKDPLADAAE